MMEGLRAGFMLGLVAIARGRIRRAAELRVPN